MVCVCFINDCVSTAVALLLKKATSTFSTVPLSSTRLGCLHLTTDGSVFGRPQDAAHGRRLLLCTLSLRTHGEFPDGEKPSKKQCAVSLRLTVLLWTSDSATAARVEANMFIHVATRTRMLMQCTGNLLRNNMQDAFLRSRAMPFWAGGILPTRCAAAVASPDILWRALYRSHEVIACGPSAALSLSAPRLERAFETADDKLYCVCRSLWSPMAPARGGFTSSCLKEVRPTARGLQESAATPPISR